MKKILVLTHAGDGTVDMVVNKLHERGADFIRFNTEEFPEKVGLTIWWDNGILRGNLKISNQNLNLKEIGTIWNRRPHKSEIHSISDPVAKKWAEEESYYSLQCLWTLMRDRFWVNPILESEKIQFNKWIQAQVAHKVGLETPESILTNHPNDVIRFYRLIKNDLALKVMRSVAVHYDDKILLLHTKKLKGEDLSENTLDSVRYSPVFLQRYIEKKSELRITVVGDKVFTCEISSQVDTKTLDDWRKHIFLKEELPHRPFELPINVERKCLDLVRELGLCFGAIDMILTPEDRFVFLEINPNGQWAWIEQLINMPISTAIADLLIKGSSTKTPV